MTPNEVLNVYHKTGQVLYVKTDGTLSKTRLDTETRKEMLRQIPVGSKIEMVGKGITNYVKIKDGKNTMRCRHRDRLFYVHYSRITNDAVRVAEALLS